MFRNLSNRMAALAATSLALSLGAFAAQAQNQERRARIDVEQYTIEAEISPNTQSITAKAGIRFVPVQFTPSASVHKGQLCHGAYLVLTDRDACNVVDVGLLIARTLYRWYPNQFNPDKIKHLLLHQPTLDAVKADKSLADIRSSWRAEVEEFQKRREKFLIYK